MTQPDPQARLGQLLDRTSRTFALTIPLLPDPLRGEVTVAYLLFRIADTFEDACDWPAEERVRSLTEFAALVERPDAERALRLATEWLRHPPLRNRDYLELLEETPLVLDCFRALRGPARAAIGAHTRRTAEGMAGFAARAGSGGGVLRLESVAALSDYCYVVAGIVGEMLTELFLLEPRLSAAGPALRARARHFGEGLQLVNILKDSDADAREGRIFLPGSASRAEILALARADLRVAAEYVLQLQQAGAPDGVVAFTALPVRLARATLDRVEAEGPGAKISRLQLWRIVQGTRSAIARGRPAVEPDGDSVAARLARHER